MPACLVVREKLNFIQCGITPSMTVSAKVVEGSNRATDTDLTVLERRYTEPVNCRPALTLMPQYPGLTTPAVAPAPSVTTCRLTGLTPLMGCSSSSTSWYRLCASSGFHGATMVRVSSKLLFISCWFHRPPVPLWLISSKKMPYRSGDTDTSGFDTSMVHTAAEGERGWLRVGGAEGKRVERGWREVGVVASVKRRRVKRRRKGEATHRWRRERWRIGRQGKANGG